VLAVEELDRFRRGQVAGGVEGGVEAVGQVGPEAQGIVDPSGRDVGLLADGIPSADGMRTSAIEEKRSR